MSSILVCELKKKGNKIILIIFISGPTANNSLSLGVTQRKAAVTQHVESPPHCQKNPVFELVWFVMAVTRVDKPFY